MSLHNFTAPVFTVAIVSLFLAFGHIYLGTLGMRGAYPSMRDGLVDETWAKEHHPYWYVDLKAGRVEEASGTPLIAQPSEPARSR